MKKHNTNIAKLDIALTKAQCHVVELEWYKECCEKEYGITYYDSFKKHDKKDNMLVEPLNIAHYYCKFKGNDNYLQDGRLTRHKVFQKWMEDKEETHGSRG